jgi:hypothetical protein
MRNAKANVVMQSGKTNTFALYPFFKSMLHGAMSSSQPNVPQPLGFASQNASSVGINTKNMFSLFGAIPSSTVDTLSRALTLLCDTPTRPLDRVEAVFEPLAADKAKLGLSRISLIEERVSNKVEKVYFRSVGRPQAPNQHICMIRTCMDAQLFGGDSAPAVARSLLMLGDYRFAYEMVQRGMSFIIGAAFGGSNEGPSGTVSSLNVKIYQLYKIRKPHSRNEDDLELVDADKWIVEVEMFDSKSVDQNLAETVLMNFNSKVLTPLGISAISASTYAANS